MMREELQHVQLASAETLGGFDRWAPSYDIEPNAFLAATAWVLDRAPLGCGGVDVLELGCGTGRHALRAIQEGAASYTGLDGSDGMLSIARQHFRDPRIAFGQVDLLAPWTTPKQYDLALISLVLEHLPNLDALMVSLARAIKPNGRVRIVDLHPERVASGSAAHFRDGGTDIHFTSFAHDVPMLCIALEQAGFDVVRRDWLVTDTMAQEVPGLAMHRGLRLVLDLKLTRRTRDRRNSSSPP